MQKPADIKREWCLIDAKGEVLGRLATKIAIKLMGKDKPEFTPHNDGGAFVIVTNAAFIKVTGNKESDKIYYWHSSFPGGLKQRTFSEQKRIDARQIIEQAVLNMLPKNKLRDGRMSRLKVYLGEEHPHQKQLQTK